MSPSRLLVATLILLGAACASSEQRVPLPDQSVTTTRANLTRIYFVRDDGGVGQRQDVRVVEGDREIGRLTRGTFLCWERPGGRTVGRAFYEGLDRTQGRVEAIIDLNCDSGRAYYFNVTVAREGGKPDVVPLSVEDGRRLVAEREPAGKH